MSATKRCASSGFVKLAIILLNMKIIIFLLLKEWLRFIIKIVKIFFILLTFLFLGSISNSLALSVEKRLENQEQEEKANEIFKEIRCLVCEAQSIESSDTEFSRSLRQIIRQKINQNLSSKEIKADLKNQFGEQIFMSVENNSANFLIWFAPFIFGIFLSIFIFYYARKR